MKYTLLAIAAALVAVALSSCACPSGKARHSLSPTATVGHEACCAQKPAAAPAGKSAGTCSDPMSPSCGGNCTPGDCRCVKHPCKCAPKVAAKPKPKPAVRHVAASPAPLPPPVVVKSPPATRVEREAWAVYRQEFAHPLHTVPTVPGQPLPPGVYPPPAQDGFWQRGSYSERVVPVRP